MRNVLRLSVGDMLVLSLPGGLSQESTLCKVDDGAKKLTLQVCSSQSKDGASSNSAAFSQAQKAGASRSRLVLLQFIPKPPKMELIVRQATECGVAAIVPVIGDYTQGGSEKASALYLFVKYNRKKHSQRQLYRKLENRKFKRCKPCFPIYLILGKDFNEVQS